MKHLTFLTTICLIVGCLSAAARAQDAGVRTDGQTQSPAVLLEKGVYNEETVGDLDAAIAIYQQIVDDAQANRTYAAQAQYRLGMCYQKKGDNVRAVAAFAELVATFSDQKELVDKARQQIVIARQNMSDANIAAIVSDAVATVSTLAEGDRRIEGVIDSLRALKEPVVVKALTRHFDSDKDAVRRAAIFLIWKGGFNDASVATPGLVKLCAHKEDFTRGMAALALGELKAPGALSALSTMATDDTSGYARRAAAYALGLLGEQRAVRVLEQALKDKDALVRNNAEAALTMLRQASGATPQVVNTSPPVFANDVDPETSAVSVTFDRPMQDGSWSFTSGDRAFYQQTGSAFPELAGEIAYDAARTTCTTPVKLKPGVVYWLGVNGPRHHGFRSADGVPAKQRVLLFATRSADGKPTPLPEELVALANKTNAPERPEASSARDVASNFLVAVKAGNVNEAITYASPGSAVGHQLGDFAGLSGLAAAEITGCFASPDAAMAVTSEVGGDHGRAGPLVFSLSRSRGLWVIHDIDLKSPADARKELDDFLTHERALAAPYAVAAKFVSSLAPGEVDGALKLLGADADDSLRQELPKAAPQMDWSGALPIAMQASDHAARVAFWPMSVKATGARFYLCLELAHVGADAESWRVKEANFLEDESDAVLLVFGRDDATTSAAAEEALRGKLVTWVEKFFSENFRDITARKTLEWGAVETTPAGNLSIRYKYLATIWDKDRQIIEQRFTFTPTGEYVSVETIEKRPADQDAAQSAAARKDTLASSQVIVTTLLNMLETGRAEQAYALTTPEYRAGHPDAFAKLTEACDFSKAELTDALAVESDACVVLSGLTLKKDGKPISLGLGLRRRDGSLLIRDVDALPTDEARQKFIDGFRQAATAVATYQKAPSEKEGDTDETSTIDESRLLELRRSMDLSSPEATIKAFMSAGARGETEKALACMTAQSHDYDDVARILGPGSKHPMAAMFAAVDPEAEIKITKTKYDGPQHTRCEISWTVTFAKPWSLNEHGRSMSFQAGDTFTLDGQLEKVGDIWLIRGI